jgi:hypothetical protein
VEYCCTECDQVRHTPRGLFLHVKYEHCEGDGDAAFGLTGEMLGWSSRRLLAERTLVNWTDEGVE